MGKLTEDQIQLLVETYIKKSIEGWDRAFEHAGGEDRPYSDPETFYSYVSDLASIKEELIVKLNLGDFSMLEGSIDTFLKDNGIDEVDKESPSYRKLSAEIHKAETKLLPIQQQHMQCDFSYKDQLPILFPEVFAAKGDSPPERREKEEPRKDKRKPVKLSQVFKEYWEEKEKKLKPRSIPEFKRALDHFVEFAGEDTDINEIDAEAIRKYKEKLTKEEVSPGKVRSASTINNKYLGMVKGLFADAKKNQYVRENPADGISVTEGKKIPPHELQDPFTEEELKKMFCGSLEYGEDGFKQASNFWLPIIALYTGMRMEEICQLYVSDVKEKDGIWGLDIVEDESKPDKSVKTSEGRFVPLHPFVLEELGFVRFVQQLPDKEGRVFADLTRIGNRYGHHVSLWFTKFRTASGIEAPPRRKTFHSFRHTVIDHLLQKGASDIAVAGLVGHTLPGETKGRYKKPLKPKNLLEQAVLKLDYGLNLSHLKTSKWVVKRGEQPPDGTI